MSLRYKLIAAIGAVEGPMLLVLAWHTEFFFHRTVEQAMVGNSRTTVDLFGKACTDALSARDLRALDANVRHIGRGQEVVYAEVEDERGVVLAHTDDQYVGRKGIDRDDRDFDRINDGVYDVSAPVLVGAQRVGTVRLGFSVEGIQELLARGRRRAISLGLLAVALGLSLAWLMLGRVVHSILLLREGATRLGSGKLEHRLNLRTGDEVEELAQTFNQMAGQLRDSYASLEQRVEERTRELVEMQHELVQSEKLAALGQLSAGIAHEVRNPLTVVSASTRNIADALQRGGDNRADIEEELGAITRNVQRAQRIISEVLEFARPAAHRPMAVDLNRVVSSVLSILGEECARKSIRIQTRLSTQAWAVCSLETIKEALLNVVVNGIQAMPGGGELTITTLGQEATNGPDGIGIAEPQAQSAIHNPQSEMGSWATVIVSDTGCGIKREDLNHIFDPFFTTREPGEGTGLGLSITRAAVTTDGGQIDVESSVGEGTQVAIRLPGCLSQSDTASAT